MRIFRLCLPSILFKSLSSSIAPCQPRERSDLQRHELNTHFCSLIVQLPDDRRFCGGLPFFSPPFVSIPCSRPSIRRKHRKPLPRREDNGGTPHKRHIAHSSDFLPFFRSTRELVDSRKILSLPVDTVVSKRSYRDGGSLPKVVSFRRRKRKTKIIGSIALSFIG